MLQPSSCCPVFRSQISTHEFDRIYRGHIPEKTKGVCIIKQEKKHLYTNSWGTR